MFTSCYTDTEISQGYQQHMWDELCHIVVGVRVVFVSLHVVSVDEWLYPLLQICRLKRKVSLCSLKKQCLENLFRKWPWQKCVFFRFTCKIWWYWHQHNNVILHFSYCTKSHCKDEHQSSFKPPGFSETLHSQHQK